MNSNVHPKNTKIGYSVYNKIELIWVTVLTFHFVPLQAMNSSKKNVLLVFLSLLFCFSFAQNNNKVEQQNNNRPLIQFSGVVVGSDSLDPIPFTSLIIKNTNRGTIGDYFGYFSFVAQTSDTVEFAALGYKRAFFVIPDSLVGNKYSLIEVLQRDTIFLKETLIFPWPTPDQFKKAFLELNLPDDDMARANYNLAQEQMRERIKGTPADASLNYKFTMQEQYSKLYYAGQYPSVNLLNPVAWSKFIKAWQNGEYKKKD